MKSPPRSRLRRSRRCWKAATCWASPRPAPARRRPSLCRSSHRLLADAAPPPRQGARAWCWRRPANSPPRSPRASATYGRLRSALPVGVDRSAASRRARRSRCWRAASKCWSPPPAACSTISAGRDAVSATSNAWCSTRPTTCSTSASSVPIRTHRRDAAEGSPDPVLLGDHAQGNRRACERSPARSRSGLGRAGCDHRRAGRPARRSRRQRRQARRARRTDARRDGVARHRLHPHQARRRPRRAAPRERRRLRRRRSTATRARTSASARSTASRAATCGCSSPPTSPRAASTSTA